MAELLRGAEAAKALTQYIKGEAAALRARGVSPCLAIVRVGENGADLAYERGAAKRCLEAGIEVRHVELPRDVSQSELLAALDTLGRDESVHGILPLRPLPEQLDDRAVCAAIAPAKDVDGVTGRSAAAVYLGSPDGCAPCTAEACIVLLHHYGVPIAGKRAVVVGRSAVVGRPLAMLLLREHATVTLCHSKTEDLPAVCREADVLIAAVGRAGLIGADCVRAGQTVLDVGIHSLPDGTLCGDVRTGEVAPIVAAVTPVPGGVGAVTTSVLALHTLRAAQAAAGVKAAGR